MNAQLLSTAEFLDRLVRSRVLEPARLDEYLRQRGGPNALPGDGQEFANQLTSDGLLTSFQADRLVAGEWQGLVVGDYRLLAPLGAPDSMVHLAEPRKGTNGRFALKRLAGDQALRPAALARFRREAKALAALDHPNVIRIHEYGEHKGQPFLLTEYVEGRSLVEVVAKDGPLPVVQAARLIRDAAVGLEHIHQGGLVHRDIKPSHLLLARDGCIKLLDLGLARFMDDPEPLTGKFESGQVLGTIEFLAPEQVIDSHEVDIRADVYGLGATFYYLLTGRAPFSHHALLRLAAGVMTHPQPLTQVRSDVPRELAAILERMMAFRPEERYSSPGEAAAALNGWLLAAPVTRAVRPLPRCATTVVPIVTMDSLDEEEPTSAVEETPAEDGVSGWGMAIVVLGACLAFLVAGLLARG